VTAELDAAYRALEDGLAESLDQGGRLAVIKAPPGSGKTHLLVTVLLRLVSLGMRVAVAAQTNAQADDICRRVTERAGTVAVCRFASAGHRPPEAFPGSVVWASRSADLPSGAGVTVSTAAKWALTDVNTPFDLLAIDEAWQMAWADLMQCATVSERYLLIGDPGQIPPVVTVDVRRWETSPRAPHAAAPDVVLRDSYLYAEAFVGSLPACRRLPHEAVDFIRPFYDFEFAAYVASGSRRLQHRAPRFAPLAAGLPVALTCPTPDRGPPLEVDLDIAAIAASTVEELMADSATVSVDGRERALAPEDIGLTSSHRIMNAAMSQALGGRFPGVRVDTPERWQGLERPVMLAVHPLSGADEPSAFDLETGRLCVMASRHQCALIVLSRDHVGDTLANLVPSAEQAPGKPDIVGRGHDAHIRFWRQLEAGDLISSGA
jgi:hypothetical protein